MSWLLILYLSTGAIDRVVPCSHPLECHQRADLAMRMDPSLRVGYCMLLNPEIEA